MHDPLPLLLQLTDSQFPSGAFAHSGGLEGLLEGRASLRDDELRSLGAALFELQLLPCDGRIGVLAHGALRTGDVERLVELDHELLARKSARELREASVTTGRSFLDEAAAIVGDARLAAFRARVAARESPGNHAVAFFAATAAAGAGDREAAIAWAYQAAAQMTSALLRLGLVGHRQAQRLLAELGALGARGIGELLDRVEPAASFAPLLEIASMRHERQYSRLFRS